MKNPEVLRNPQDFNRLYKKGKSSGSKYVVVLYKQNNLPYKRRAFLASKKVGNSVARHRAVRLMRESYRQLISLFPDGYDYIFIARNSITNCKCADVKKSIEAAMKRANILAHVE